MNNVKFDFKQPQRQYCGLLILLMALSSGAQSDNENMELLGVINGSIMQRSTLTELTPFLSGRPVYQYDGDDNAATVQQLVIERARLSSRQGQGQEDTVWIQQPVELTTSEQGQFQLPLRVLLNGKAVKVTAKEESRGVVLTLPEGSRQVRVVPAGAITFTLPSRYRGDIRADIRIVEVSSVSEENP